MSNVVVCMTFRDNQAMSWFNHCRCQMCKTDIKYTYIHTYIHTLHQIYKAIKMILSQSCRCGHMCARLISTPTDNNECTHSLSHSNSSSSPINTFGSFFCKYCRKMVEIVSALLLWQFVQVGIRQLHVYV